jgi:hypothetical protein
MRKTKKRVRIVVEQRRRLAGADRFAGPCSLCGCEVDMLTRQEAASFLEIGLEGVESLAASGRIHAIFTAAGSYRVCKRSLLQGPNRDQGGGFQGPQG